MRKHLRGIYLVTALCALVLYAPALAAPDRLNDDVPDAVPDREGALSFSYGREMIDVEGPLNDERTAHDYYKLRYTFSPKVATSFRVTRHDLVGGLGLFTPILDNQDFAESYTVDLGLNLMNVPATAADPDNSVAFAAGSSFGIGVSGSQFQLDAANLSRDETLLKAYLTYSTDLSEEMRAHTYFSSGRLSGDAYTGSVNRVGAGLDYNLSGGKRPLTLMANGILDIYNFRQPSFNTSRVSRFDVGLRYRMMEDWYASVGWVTLNDSENDSSGSGFFAGINFVDEPADPKDEEECEEVAEEEVPAPVEEPKPQAAAGGETVVAAGWEQPPLMAQDRLPSQGAVRTASGAGDAGNLPEDYSLADQASLDLALQESGEGTNVSGGPYYYDEERAQLNTLAEQTAAAALPPTTAAPAGQDGIEIPPFPVTRPKPTPPDAVMVRAGIDEVPKRPETNSQPDTAAAPTVDEAVAEVLAESAAPGAVGSFRETGVGEIGWPSWKLAETDLPQAEEYYDPPYEPASGKGLIAIPAGRPVQERHVVGAPEVPPGPEVSLFDDPVLWQNGEWQVFSNIVAGG